MDILENYKLDKCFTDGVEITLDNAPEAVFMVKLPSTHNREYARVLYSGAKYEVDEQGNITSAASMVEAMHANQDAFIKGCMISLNGKPVPVDFAEKYPEALAELMVKAREMADNLDQEAADIVKKPVTSTSGATHGPTNGASTSSLKAAAG